MEAAEQTYSLLELAPYIVALAGSVAMVYVAWLRYRKSPHQAVAVKAGAIDNLTKSVDTLTTRLSEEREARLQDCIDFERNLDGLRTELSDRCDRRIIELKTYYEERISRLEQAHRDRVEALKTRIKELENKVDNGSIGG